MNPTQGEQKKRKLTSAESLTLAIEKLKVIGNQFSRIAISYHFNNDAPSYLQWAILFGAEMDNQNLSKVLTTNPESSSSSSVPTAADILAAQRQKTVYHMILKCVPKEISVVVTTSLLEAQRTGFGAWLALRQFYIGEERAYITKLEEKFTALCWESNEFWPSFETRFDSLVNDLRAIGKPKDEHQQRIRLMAAIQQSGRRDAEGSSVYTRLHITNLIQAKEPYRIWLVAIRTEAQKIQDEIQSSKGKKRRTEDAHSTGDHVGEVSQVDSSSSSSSSSQRPPFGQNRNMSQSITSSPSRSKEACRNFQRGQCRFGANCRFSHVNSSNDTNNSNRSNNATKKFKVNKPCFNFRDGKCTFGDQCRFLHTSSSTNSASNNSTAGAAFLAQVDVFNVESDNIIMKNNTSTSSSSNRNHRVIIDSGCSEHLTCRLDWLRDLKSLKRPITVRGAFGKSSTATQCGDMYLSVNGNNFVIKDVIYCDSLQDTLLSFCRLINRGHRVDLDQKKLVPQSGSFSIPLSMVGNILTFADEPSLSDIESTMTAEA